MRESVREKIATLPDAPGVYLMIGGPAPRRRTRRADPRPTLPDAPENEVLYVGKAKSLQARWRSYLSGSDTRAFVALLDDLLTDVEVILTSTEKEALILEDQLIKKHQPRFNVKLTDDKRFLCLRLDTSQPYPRLELVRRFGRDAARYFGPYHSASSIRQSLRIINRHFQLRTCSDEVMRSRTRPCLQHQIKRCPAPCVFDIEDLYAQHVQNTAAFLEGRHSELIETLERRMKDRAAALEFELAAQLRDQIYAVSRSLERQGVVSVKAIDRDAVGMFREGPEIEIHVMRTRDGRMIDPHRFSFSDREQPNGELLADFAMRYYGAEEIPDEILFPPEMEWASALAQLLGERAGRTVRVLAPQRGDKRRQVELAVDNARQAFADKTRKQIAAQTAIDRLRRALHLSSPPARIECVDVSHLQGEVIVASVVRFDSGIPNKKLYRHYRVRSTSGQDDFKSMYEIVSRRARRGIENTDLPDLLVIDGGKGQLAAARAALDDHGIDTVDLIGLAKARPKKSDDTGPKSDPVERSPERVFVQGQKNAIVLRQNSAELFLLTRARDEAHRFAITFHRRARRKKQNRSILDDVPGIGTKRRRALLRHFGSVARIEQASVQEIAEVVGPVAAAAVRAHLEAASS